MSFEENSLGVFFALECRGCLCQPNCFSAKFQAGKSDLEKFDEVIS